MRPDDVRHGRAANEPTRSGSRRVTDHLPHLGLGVTSPVRVVTCPVSGPLMLT